jgi:predicted kinase
VKGKITFIIGLPGSGKTTFAKEQYPSAVILDDFCLLKDPLGQLRKLLKDGKHCIVIDPYLCYRHNQDNARRRLANLRALEWVFFENCPKLCLANVEARAKKGDNRVVAEFIRQASSHYYIPKGANIREVYHAPAKP